MKDLSDAQREFLRDKRTCVTGGYNSPAVRTMRSLIAKGLIRTVEEWNSRGHRYELTTAGAKIARALRR